MDIEILNYVTSHGLAAFVRDISERSLKMTQKDGLELMDSLLKVRIVSFHPGTREHRDMLFSQCAEYLRPLQTATLLRKLFQAYGQPPRALMLRHVTIQHAVPVACGAYADIYRGLYQGRPAALKRFRLSGCDREKASVQRVS